MSVVKNCSHITFSTKGRFQFISTDIQHELWSYIGGISKNLDCPPLIVGGHRDHVHVLCSLSQNIALKKLIQEIKARSSKWIKTKDNRFSKFYWQTGYGAFSVNPTEVDVVKRYILNQEEHHRQRTFQDEFRVFLKKYEVEYDEKYIWD